MRRALALLALAALCSGCSAALATSLAMAGSGAFVGYRLAERERSIHNLCYLPPDTLPAQE